jgi:2-(1,2-epoxy-1,2-dihydrophenyl)acetyl-CoA isomerase
MGTKVLLERKGSVAIIRLNMPDKLNLLGPELRYDLKSALSEFRSDEKSKVAVITGQGRAFCAGGDLAEMEDGISSVYGVEHMTSHNEIILMIAEIPKPIIACVNGVAAGGGSSIAMACDLVFASTDASFIQAFTKISLIPDMGSIYFLPRAVGMHKAKELIWTAREVGAEEALALGMVNALYKPEELETKVLEFAERLTEGPTFAIGLGKRLLAKSLETNLRDMLDNEALGQSICFQTEDNKEGVMAFYEKRKAVFKGK